MPIHKIVNIAWLLSDPDDQLLPRLDLVVAKIVQGFDLVDGKAFEFAGDVPQGIAILHGIGL